MNTILLERVQTLQHQAERLVREATELRQEIARVAEDIINPSSIVARYMIEGETYEVTQADVEAIRAELFKPATDEALYELAVAKKMAKKLRELPLDVRNRRFFETVEAIRAASIADGTAIDDEMEAVVND